MKIVRNSLSFVCCLPGLNQLSKNQRFILSCIRFNNEIGACTKNLTRVRFLVQALAFSGNVFEVFFEILTLANEEEFSINDEY
ncbi:hypothetical protein Desor_1898 [Desulfosporosinus orientis DSM 765]|uniref:Uncharacterized protein n=1 Tax=Desulfosporosinus orientis (strain ATCC 19365 / DSM 765 / NCIMB 8382 / VKM B-1628 / Singapore I) TaxID=768706 RepID=G7WB23_DESOD|nr:hypothetical protein [Desulfosporosinus orientis]AET67524.1 hypothetical protein Desor_1898 [Desulfosporosinus orientis DSM 765]